MTKRTRSDNNGSYKAEEVKNDKKDIQMIIMVPVKVCHTVTWGVQPTNRGQGLLHFFITIILFSSSYESIATVGEIRVWWRANFQSGSRVLKKVF